MYRYVAETHQVSLCKLQRYSEIEYNPNYHNGARLNDAQTGLKRLAGASWPVPIGPVIMRAHWPPICILGAEELMLVG